MGGSVLRSSDTRATILIVDDERLLCDLFREILATAGYAVVTANSGSEGIHQFKETRPQATILDLLLPDMDGLAVLREIRKLDGSAPVIVLTGIASSLMEEEARRVGVSDFLGKSLDLETVVQSVHRVTGVTDGTPTERAAAAEESPHILVVDDDPQVRQLMFEFLIQEPERYRVSTAATGEDALDHIARERPQLILLDLVMPRMEGIEVLRRLAREAPEIGVIVISGAGDHELVKRAMDLGSFDYFSKPVDFEQLGVSIRAELLVGARRQRPWHSRILHFAS